jgi:hypothetical protein
VTYRVLKSDNPKNRKITALIITSANLLLILLFFLVYRQLPALDSGKSYQVVTESISRSEKTYILDIKYPRLDFSGENPNYEKFNKLVNEMLRDETEYFTGNSLKNQIEDNKKWELKYDYTIRFQSNKLISLVLEGIEYTGGLHPNMVFRTVLFDLDNGKEIRLQDLFLEDSQYLERIARCSVKILINRQLPEITVMGPGTEPKKENFELFFISVDGIGIIFPPYQVASFADGPQEIIIPFNSMEDLINPGGPIGKIYIYKSS